MRQYEFSAAAEKDLTTILDRIAADDPNTAQAVARRFRASVETVCLFPRAGKQTDKQHVWIFGGTKNQPFRFTFKVFADHILILRVFRHSRGQIPQ